jgi:hypothetical protein
LTRWDHPGLDLASADFEKHRAQCRAHRPFRDFTYRALTHRIRELHQVIPGRPRTRVEADAT